MSENTKMEVNEPLTGVGTVMVREVEGKPSNVVVIAGSEEELDAFLKQYAITGTEVPAYVSFLIGNSVKKIILPN